MFGYVVPDKMNMYMKDYYRYRAFYCGLCKSIGHTCGQCMRLTTNYDVTFLSLLVHGIMEVEPTFKNEGCILNPIKKKTIAQDSALMQRIVDVNTLLTYYKLVDDKLDGGSATKAIARVTIVESKYKRAKANFPELDAYYKRQYDLLNNLEKENCDSLDRLADTFASMLKETIRTLTCDKYTDNIGDLMYNIGRWVYFMDAVDDVDDDFKKKRFNPFLVGYEYENREKFNTDKADLVEELLMFSYNRICESFEKTKLTVNEGVLTNIIWYGILQRTKEIIGRTTKCKRIRI